MIISFKDIIVYILGPSYEETRVIIPFLVFIPILGIVGDMYGIGIELIKKTYYHTYITVFVSIVNLVGNYYFISTYGAKGAALMTSLSYILMCFLKIYISKKLYFNNLNFEKIYISILILFVYALYSINLNKGILFDLVLALGLIMSYIYIYRFYMDDLKNISKKFLKLIFIKIKAKFFTGLK